MYKFIIPLCLSFFRSHHLYYPKYSHFLDEIPSAYVKYLVSKLINHILIDLRYLVWNIKMKSVICCNKRVNKQSGRELKKLCRLSDFPIKS